MPTVTVDRVTEALNLTPRRIQQLVKEGMPREKRGEYDPIKCMLWYIRYLKAQISRLSPNVSPAGGEVDDERKERCRLLRANRELRELELARARGEFMSLIDIEKIMAEFVVMTRVRILAVPNRIAPQLVGEDRVVIEARLDKALGEALTSLANYNENGNAVRTAVSELTAPLTNDSDTES
jgi:phage terminase Nu1 subunit (DNA packaging protein)